MGLWTSQTFFDGPLSGRINDDNDIGKNFRFVKNGINVNKGKKIEEFLPAYAIENLKKHRFKKGDVPHNLLPIGAERFRSDGYVEVKVRDLNSGSSEDNFELKQRWIYQQHHGPILEGMLVVFKDSDKLNFEIENLELISMFENLRRNFDSDTCIVKKYMGVKDDEIVKLIIENAPKTIELQRKINKVKKEIRCRT